MKNLAGKNLDGQEKFLEKRIFLKKILRPKILTNKIPRAKNFLKRKSWGPGKKIPKPKNVQKLIPEAKILTKKFLEWKILPGKNPHGQEKIPGAKIFPCKNFGPTILTKKFLE